MTDTLDLTFTYADTPPSFNAVGSRGGRMSFHRAKKVWQEVFETLLLSTGFPRGWERMECSAVLRFPTRARRDEGNYRTILEKALGDALTNGGWLPDDTPDHYRFDRAQFDPERGTNQTSITLKATK